MADAMSAAILEIIDLDAPDLPSINGDIYKVELEWVLVEPWSRGSRPLSPPHPWPRPRLKQWSPPKKSPHRVQLRSNSRHQIGLELSEVSSP
jgi:hypothetical protein